MKFEKIEKIAMRNRRVGAYDDVFKAFIKSGLDVAKVTFDKDDVEKYKGQLKTWWEHKDEQIGRKYLSNIASTINARIKASWLDTCLPLMKENGVKIRYENNGQWPVLPHCFCIDNEIVFEYVLADKAAKRKYEMRMAKEEVSFDED